MGRPTYQVLFLAFDRCYTFPWGLPMHQRLGYVPSKGKRSEQGWVQGGAPNPVSGWAPSRDHFLIGVGHVTEPNTRTARLRHPDPDILYLNQRVTSELFFEYATLRFRKMPNLTASHRDRSKDG